MCRDVNVIAIITAGGKGLRMGSDIPKQFLPLGGKSILEKTVDTFRSLESVDRILITLPDEHIDEVKDVYPDCELIAGGEERQASVRNGIIHANPRDEDIVLIHDGVRPFCTEEIVERVIEKAYEIGAAIPGIPSTDTIRHEDDGTLDRSKLYRVQTPQGFRGHIIKEAYEKALKDGFLGTDDASLVDRLGREVAIVEGSERNIKITNKKDLPSIPRIGTGFDVHKFSPDRKLILCGIEIPYEQGLDGHSDADVATHALMDAILGAAGLPDIGTLFPDNAEEYKGIRSMILLERVREKILEKGFKIGNVDITIICQEPKLAPYIEAMKGSLASSLGIDISSVGLKATTTEKLGFTGRGEGIAAEAVCLLIS